MNCISPIITYLKHKNLILCQNQNFLCATSSLQSKTCLFENIQVCALCKSWMVSNVKDGLQKACNKSWFFSVLSDGSTAKSFYVILCFVLFLKNGPNKAGLLIIMSSPSATGESGGHCRPSPVGSRGKAPENFGYLHSEYLKTLVLWLMNSHLSIFRWINFYTFESLGVWVGYLKWYTSF